MPHLVNLDGSPLDWVTLNARNAAWHAAHDGRESAFDQSTPVVCHECRQKRHRRCTGQAMTNRAQYGYQALVACTCLADHGVPA